MAPINCCYLLLLLAAVWLAPIQPLLAGQDANYIQKTFEKMNNCLAKRWKEAKGLDENMKLIDKCVNLSFINIWTGEHPMRDLGVKMKQLTKLTDGESMCFSSGYNILKEILEYSKSLPHLMKLIRAFIMRNGEYCEPIYASLGQQSTDDGLCPEQQEPFRKLTSNLLEEVYGMSEEKMETFLVEAIESENSINLRDYIKETFAVKKDSFDFNNLMHKTALEVVRHKPNYEGYIEDYKLSRMSMRPDYFTRTILRELVKPCGDFVEAMDKRKIFQMASLQTKVLQRNFKLVAYNNEHIHGSVYDLVSFYRNWILYEACKTYILPNDIYKQVHDMRKMILGDLEHFHEYPATRVKLPNPTIVKLDELIE